MIEGSTSKYPRIEVRGEMRIVKEWTATADR